MPPIEATSLRQVQHAVSLKSPLVRFGLDGNQKLRTTLVVSQLSFLEETISERKTALPSRKDTTTTFQDNLSLPVHRWFRYSAGFSGSWVASVIHKLNLNGQHLVLDPFAGAGTTPLECEFHAIKSVGLDPHPFVAKVARAKLCWRSDVVLFQQRVEQVVQLAKSIVPELSEYPSLIGECYDTESLMDLDRLRRAVATTEDGTPAWQLVWLVLAAIIRPTSKAGTAQWQYVLPKKSKKRVVVPFEGFRIMAEIIAEDMRLLQKNGYQLA
jgi:hypothetical protein